MAIINMFKDDAKLSTNIIMVNVKYYHKVMIAVNTK